MRVVSLVPSWTETLLACGVEVVGRTRYCIHPAELVKSIPVVGGTKDLDLQKLEAAKPDLLLVDQEENLPWMASPGAWKVHCTHVSRTADVPFELEELARVLGNEQLKELAGSWRSELAKPVFSGRPAIELQGVQEWLRKPTSEPETILYLIWRDPWMAVSPLTFIGSMLSRLGYGDRLHSFQEKYPKIELADFDPSRTLLLFSSEPFPFAKKIPELLPLGFPCAIVDGESYSWFGNRALRFLEKAL